ncbi:MAG: WD40 repeat domain-containing protein [Microcystaceae cyanobacterium]
MKFQSQCNRPKSYWALVSTISLVIGCGSHLAAQAQLPPTPQKVTPEVEEPSAPEHLPEAKPEVEFEFGVEERLAPTPWKQVRLMRTIRGNTTVVDALAFSADGKIIISGGSHNDPFLRFWSIRDGEKLDEIRAQRTAVLTLAMSPNGRTLVSSGEDSGINLWNWTTGEYRATFLEHHGSVLKLAISPDSRILVSGGLDGIRVWELSPPQRPLYTLVGFGNPTYALAINPSNGYILASGHIGGKVKFWNLKTGKLVSEFSPHTETITGLAYTPDGSKLLTASEDRTVKVWDLDTGQLLYTLTGHSSGIRAIAMNPDGQTLASASNDGVRLWNIQNGEQLRRLIAHEDWVQSLAFSPDGHLLASGGFDATIRIWENASPSVEQPSSKTPSDEGEILEKDTDN